MGRKRKPVGEREDEFDWHVPLYDQKEFQQYAMQVVLPVIGVRPASRRKVKLRIAPTKLVSKWIDHAFEYLVLYGKIVSEVRGEGITYLSLAAQPARVAMSSFQMTSLIADPEFPYASS